MKKKYKKVVISEYANDNDTLINIYDSYKEFADYKHITLKQAYHLISNNRTTYYVYPLFEFINDDFFQADLDTITFAFEEADNEN